MECTHAELQLILSVQRSDLEGYERHHGPPALVRTKENGEAVWHYRITDEPVTAEGALYAVVRIYFIPRGIGAGPRRR